MDKKNFPNLGNQIWSTVQEALKSNDFTKLKKEISDTAENAFAEVRKNIKVNQPYSKEKNVNRDGREESRSNYKPIRNDNKPQVPIAKTPAGSISGVLFMVFGFLGTAVFGIILLVYGIVNSILSKFTPAIGAGFVVLLLIFVASLFTALTGVKLRKRVKRFKQYVRQIRGRSYCSIKELTSHTGESIKFIVKDLRKMIQLGMFPEGHIDEQQTYLMLNYEVYQQYLKTQENLELRKEEEIKKKKEVEDVTDPSLKELRKIIDEGKSCIRQIKEANDAIPGEEISRKLYRLEQITEKIFNYVEQHPEQVPEIHKLMNYYLPITLKLVNGYKELDAQPVQGENIITAKKEIEDTLDTINAAFENLLDNLFKDIAFDISTDISVLETMLTQEGLTESDFKK